MEAAPVAGAVRVGIELEGVGQVRTKWTNAAVIQEDSFHDIFKRMPLVRSPSFSADRGVYITPEDADDGYGRNSPAELVSSPHLFTTTGLNHLRDSVTKAFAPKGMRTGQATYTSALSQATAQSRWAMTRPKIGGSLQTTIGVSTAKLCNDAASVRKAAVEMLIGAPVKQGYAIDLLHAAVVGEQYLTTSLLAAQAAQKLGIRLAIFMYLTNLLAGKMANGAWAKTALGALFKGYSSFIGCGVAADDGVLRAAITAAGKTRAATQAELLQTLTANRVPAWITTELAAENDIFAALGSGGLSVHTSVEGAPPIPCFTKNNVIHTVVESREKLSGLNIKMAAFLNGKAQTDAAAFSSPVSLALH